MKRRICCMLIAVLWVFLMLPVTAFAQSYSMRGTDMTITIDDSIWYVFTPDNLQNNPELGELGVTQEYMSNFFDENQAYLDAILFYDTGVSMELIVRKSDVKSKVANLSTHDNDDVLELAEALANKAGVENYTTYQSRYKYARLDYFDATHNYYLREYYTIVNKDSYTITVQSQTPYTQEQYQEIQRIIDDIVFDVDPTLKDEVSDSIFDGVVGKALIGAVVGGCAGGLMSLLRKKKTPKESSNENEQN